MLDHLSRRELIRHVKEMHDEIARLSALRDDLRLVEDSLKQRTRVLDERTKELHCVYDVVKCLRRADLSIDQKTQWTVERLPAAFQRPAHVAIRAVIREKLFTTPGFQEDGAPAVSSPITVQARAIGRIEFFSALGRRSGDDSILNEERALIEVVAECLGTLLEHGAPAGEPAS